MERVFAVILSGSVALMFVALGLYLATFYAYDRLLMPTRFWAAGSRGGTPGWIVERPPSSSVLVLFLNMIRVWNLLFTPATLALVGGLLGLALAAFHFDPADYAIAVAVAGTIAAGYVRWARPRLGTND